MSSSSMCALSFIHSFLSILMKDEISRLDPELFGHMLYFCVLEAGRCALEYSSICVLGQMTVSLDVIWVKSDATTTDEDT